VIKETIETEESQIQPKKKQIPFKVKNVIANATGKEFTIKITDDIIAKSFNTYSGGPSSIKALKYGSMEEKYINPHSHIFIRDNNKNTFLHISVVEEMDELLEYFLLKGVPVNEKNNDGDTPLHFAMQLGNKKIIGMLLKFGAEIDIHNNDGKIPVDYASVNNILNLVRNKESLWIRS
jgi:ankyrin repeat protein